MRAIEPQQPAKPTRKGGRPGPKPSNGSGTPTERKRAEEILELMVSRPQKRDWTTKQVADELKLPRSGTQQAINYMRTAQLIRATRTTQGGGHAYAPFKKQG
jgi:hypothetical protein